MAKIDLPYVHLTRPKGRLYSYYRRGGREIGIKGEDGKHLEPGSPAWLTRYQEIHDTFENGPAVEPGIAPGSFDDLVVTYRADPEFLELAEATKSQYGVYLDHIREQYGDIAVRLANREWTLEIRAAGADQPGRTNHLLAVLRILFGFAMDRPARFRLDHNPAKGVKRLKGGKGYQPWPQTLLGRALAEAPAEVALAIQLGLDTGQRISDCIRMRWTQRRQGVLWVEQQKGGGELEIPEHPDLTERLKEAPRSAVTILVDSDGKPWTRWKLAKEIRELVERHDQPGYSFHGLRKNAAQRLAEVGCSDREIMSITGHKTTAMVSHYTKKADQRRLAKSAIAKLRRTGRKRPSGKPK